MLCIGLMSCNSNRTDEDVQTGVQNPQVVCCGVENPQNNLLWLNDLIRKANSDKTGNYVGTIWLEEYKGKNFFITNMMLGSGGVLYWIFDCNGNHFASHGVDECVACKFVGKKHFYIEDPEDFLNLSDLKKDVVVYSSFLLDIDD